MFNVKPKALFCFFLLTVSFFFEKRSFNRKYCVYLQISAGVCLYVDAKK